jgi:hypothetical protein
MKQRHLLLISGPSGGGKSTFIRQLAAKTLAPEILALMPEQETPWPVAEANNVLKGNLAKKSLREDMCRTAEWLVHYDIVFIHCYGVKSYQDDPVMDLLISADALDVVFVKPACDVLLHQFHERQIRHQLSKSKASLLWGRCCRRPLRRALAPWTGKAILTTEELYGRDHWLEACYQQWENFCRHLVDQHPPTRLTVVEPVSTADTAPEFRLISHSGPPPSASPANHD